MMMTKNKLPFVVEVERDQEKRWMCTFKERVDPQDQPRLGTVYVAKDMVGNAQRLKITIEEVE